jgi:hypothetical protein
VERVSDVPSADLAQQMALVEEARALLARGDAVGALSASRRYFRQFPDGSLLPEATVIQIDALSAAGLRSEAVAQAAHFLATSPNSPYARRISSTLASAGDK